MDPREEHYLDLTRRRFFGRMARSLGAGLGYRLFWARELFQTEVIYAVLIVIGITGLLIELFVLRALEARTVQRWGVMRELT